MHCQRTCSCSRSAAVRAIALMPPLLYVKYIKLALGGGKTPRLSSSTLSCRNVSRDSACSESNTCEPNSWGKERVVAASQASKAVLGSPSRVQAGSLQKAFSLS